MNIGIIGARHIGGTLTRRLTKLGHRVFVANSRGPQTLADLTWETGAQAVTPEQAARKGEVVILTIALKNLPKLPRGLFKRSGSWCGGHRHLQLLSPTERRPNRSN
jgi:predicted dinucleotide-binding enzyme